MDATQASHIADQILPGSTALAGLLLVVATNVTSAFESHGPAPREGVRERFRRRAWFVFWAFAASLLSALTSFLFYWWGETSLIYVSAALFLAATLCSLWTAFQAAWDIG